MHPVLRQFLWLMQQTLYRRTGFMYVSMYDVIVCCTLCCTSLFPLHQGGGGRGLAIADSDHKLDIIGVE
jgi:hypothetical protein